MDYCSSCRRHLNGALVCPGCGAYAPDIAPHVTVGDRDADTVPALSAPGPAPVPTDTPAADVVELPPARQQGRAARRRQLTRWKKNKRRAVVASAVALVGGGLSLATMDRQSGDRAQATTAPDHRSMGVADEEITERDRPVPAPTTPEDTHRSSRTPAQPYEQRHEQSQSQSSAVGAPRHQSVAEASRTAPATPPRTTASSPPPATPTLPQPPSTDTSTADSSPADTSTAGSGSADSGSGRSDSTAGRTPAPSTADGGASDTSPTSPALISTSPTEVCLLGLCLG